MSHCGGKSDWQKRNTLAIVGFAGLAVMYSIRFNLSIAIVAMVDHSSNYNEKIGTNFSLGHGDSGICPQLLPTPLNYSIDSKTLAVQGRGDTNSTFKWNEKDQGLILGSFFWGYVITQFPGGILAQRYGGKWIVSLGLLSAGLLSLILPWAAIFGGKNFVLMVRFLQGVCEGVILPAFTVLLGKWTSPNERASIATLCFSGMPFGTAMTMVISGHLISIFGWPAAFYAPGIFAIIWFICWSLLVYSSPKEHPTISKIELNFIESSLNENDTDEDQTQLAIRDIPWKNILCSVHVYAIFISHFTNTWGHNTLKAEGPKYLHSVLHFDIHENAYIAAIPYLCQWIFCNIVIRLSDYMISKNILSLSSARRLCNTIGQAGTGLAFLCLILADCNRSLAILSYILCGLFNGGVYGGMLINPIDISPNYAGVIEGLINGVANIAGFGAPFVAGLILNNEPSIYGWRYVFLIPVAGDLIGNLFFVLFCSTEVQPWNNRKDERSKKELETISERQ